MFHPHASSSPEMLTVESRPGVAATNAPAWPGVMSPPAAAVCAAEASAAD